MFYKTPLLEGSSFSSFLRAVLKALPNALNKAST
jgi:hypothetical protein